MREGFVWRSRSSGPPNEAMNLPKPAGRRLRSRDRLLGVTSEAPSTTRGRASQVIAKALTRQAVFDD